MPRRKHRAAPVTGGGVAVPTDAQYRLLRYWAANTADDPARGADPRLYADRYGIPNPTIQSRTIDTLRTRGWWLKHAQRGFVVLDAGRAACGLPPVYRDHPCPIVWCAARTGERCRVRVGERAGPYTDRVHELRVALHPAPPPPPVHPSNAVHGNGPGRRAGGPIPIDASGLTTEGRARSGRHNDHPDPEQALHAALTAFLPAVADRLGSAIEPRHVGLLVAT